MIATETKLLVGSHSDKGPRENNEDTVLSIVLSDGRWLVAVADGMGGLAKGELASKTALGALYRHLSAGDRFAEALSKAGSAVFEEAEGENMGTTLVAALFTGPMAEIANVGDSRAYHLDPLGLVQVTEDHTIGQEASKEEFVSAEELDSPWAGALSRYLGAEREVTPDFFGPLELHEGGWFLLCSDGLHRVLSPDRMERLLREETDPAKAAKRIVKEALEAGTWDNVSVALVYRPKDDGGGSRPLVASNRKHLPWSPERFISTSRRTQRARKRRRLAVVAFLVLIPILAATAWVLTT